MCGLVGVYSSNMTLKHRDVLASLLYLDTWRGKDSTGVAAIRQNADTVTLKSTVPGHDFIEHNKFNEHLKNTDFCWIGHNRFGTIGRNIKTNAHPFEILDEDGACLLVGAHNGTLKNKHTLPDHLQFGTDSEAMFNSIALKGVKDTVAMLDGAWAITYYDHIAEELRFVRNDERPLFYAYEEGKRTMFWASEDWMIRVATSRAGLKLEDNAVYNVVKDELYRFPAPMKVNDVITVEREGGVVGKPPAFFHINHNPHGYQRTTGGTSGQSNQQTTLQEAATQARQAAAARAAAAQRSLEDRVRAAAAARELSSASGTEDAGGKPPLKNDSSSKQPQKANSDNVITINAARKYKGFGGVLYTQKEMEAQLEDGCSWCEVEPITLDDTFAWLKPSKPICQKCLKGSHTTNEQLVATVH